MKAVYLIATAAILVAFYYAAEEFDQRSIRTKQDSLKKASGIGSAPVDTTSSDGPARVNQSPAQLEPADSAAAPEADGSEGEKEVKDARPQKRNFVAGSKNKDDKKKKDAKKKDEKKDEKKGEKKAGEDGESETASDERDSDRDREFEREFERGGIARIGVRLGGSAAPSSASFNTDSVEELSKFMEDDLTPGWEGEEKGDQRFRRFNTSDRSMFLLSDSVQAEFFVGRSRFDVIIQFSLHATRRRDYSANSCVRIIPSGGTGYLFEYGNGDIEVFVNRDEANHFMLKLKDWFLELRANQGESGNRYAGNLYRVEPGNSPAAGNWILYGKGLQFHSRQRTNPPCD